MDSLSVSDTSRNDDVAPRHNDPPTPTPRSLLLRHFDGDQAAVDRWRLEDAARKRLELERYRQMGLAMDAESRRARREPGLVERLQADVRRLETELTSVRRDLSRDIHELRADIELAIDIIAGGADGQPQ